MECVTKKGFSLFLFFSFMILLRYSAEIVVLLTNVTKHNKPTQLTANGHKYEESKYFLFLLTKYMCCIFKSIFVFASLGSELSMSFFSLFFRHYFEPDKRSVRSAFFSSECAAVHVKQCAQEFIVAVNSIQKIFLCKYFGFQIGYCDEHRKCDEHIPKIQMKTILKITSMLVLA